MGCSKVCLRDQRPRIYLAMRESSEVRGLDPPTHLPIRLGYLNLKLKSKYSKAVAVPDNGAILTARVRIWLTGRC